MALKTLNLKERNSVVEDDLYDLSFVLKEDEATFKDKLGLAEEESIKELTISFELPKTSVERIEGLIQVTIEDKSVKSEETLNIEFNFNSFTTSNLRGRFCIKIEQGKLECLEYLGMDFDIPEIIYGNRKLPRFSTKEKIDIFFSAFLEKKLNDPLR